MSFCSLELSPGAGDSAPTEIYRGRTPKLHSSHGKGTEYAEIPELLSSRKFRLDPMTTQFHGRFLYNSRGFDTIQVSYSQKVLFVTSTIWKRNMRRAGRVQERQ